MSGKDWNDYFTRALTEAERELADLRECIAKHGLRVFHRDVSGERDVTEDHIRDLEQQVREYRDALREE